MTLRSQGIARLPSNKLVFVSSLLPGEVATVRETSTTSGYSNAIKVQQLQPPTDSVTAPCRYIDECGGCHLQHVAYHRQLALKHELVVDALQRIAKLPDAPQLVAPVVPSAAQLHYRNNMQFDWDAQRGLLGLHAAGTNEVVALDACLLQDNEANAMLQSCARLLRAHPTAAAACARVAIRSAGSSEALRYVVGFTTTTKAAGVQAELMACAKALQREFGNVLHGVVWTQQPGKNGTRGRRRTVWMMPSIIRMHKSSTDAVGACAGRQQRPA